MQSPFQDAGHTLAKRTGASALIILTSSSLFMICTCIYLHETSNQYTYCCQWTNSMPHGVIISRAGSPGKARLMGSCMACLLYPCQGELVVLELCRISPNLLNLPVLLKPKLPELLILLVLWNGHILLLGLVHAC